MTSKYSRQHYEDVARILKEAQENLGNVEGHVYGIGQLAAIHELTRTFVQLFTDDNERFDEVRFREAVNS